MASEFAKQFLTAGSYGDRTKALQVLASDQKQIPNVKNIRNPITLATQQQLFDFDRKQIQSLVAQFWNTRLAANSSFPEEKILSIVQKYNPTQQFQLLDSIPLIKNHTAWFKTAKGKALLKSYFQRPVQFEDTDL